MQARWLLIEQQQVGLPLALLVVLVLWLAMLYGSFGLFAPRNATVILVLFVCALSASAALFLIVDMNSPLDGSRSRAGRWSKPSSRSAARAVSDTASPRAWLRPSTRSGYSSA